MDGQTTPCPQGRYFTCQDLGYPFDEAREKTALCDLTIRYDVTFNECNEINYALRNIHAVCCISISLG